MPLELEASEISGLVLRCPPGCAYCCLCPPGLLPGEDAIVLDACGGQGECIGKDFLGDTDRAVKVQGQGGACLFLADLRCSIYGSRPHFCRQYPLMVYSGWRLQLSAIRSCRGVIFDGTPGNGLPLMDIFKDEVSRLGEGYFSEVLEETRGSFQELEDDTDLFATVEEVQEEALSVADTIGDARGMARLLGMEDGKERELRATFLSDFLEEISGSFSSKDLLELPVFPAKDGKWSVFCLVGEEEMSHYRLEPDGSKAYSGSVCISELPLPDLERGAERVLRDYLTMAFRRDIYYGMVARQAHVEGVAMAHVSRVMAIRDMLDVWWRAGMLMHFLGNVGRPGPKVDGGWAREAVIFMDADLLDSYALGAII